MIKYIEGDLFAGIQQETKNVVVAHVCNDKGGWGAGFVIPLAKHFPLAKTCYLAWFDDKDISLMSNHHFISTGSFKIGQSQLVHISDQFGVVNMVAQTLGGVRPLSYKWLVGCMVQTANFASRKNAKIVAPMFGSQLAGGDWNFIEKLIEDCWSNHEVDIYYLKNSMPSNWTVPESGVTLQ